MPISDCIDRIVKAGKLTAAEAAKVLDELDRRMQRLAREKGLAPDDALREAEREMIQAQQATAAIERRNALLNLQKRISRQQRISDTAAALGGDLATAIRNQVVAINTPVNGGRLSAEAVWKTRAAEYASRVVAPLQKAGLLDALRRGTLDSKWPLELYELSLKAAGDARANPGVTGTKEALMIAQIFHDVQESARARLNRQGAWIGQYAGYITRTTHDPDKIRLAGFGKWRAFIEPRLDERTFDGVDDRAKFLEATYYALRTGVHLSDEGGVGFKDPAFVGPVNRAAKLSESRVLHFRDAEGWLDYQRQFGSGSVLQQMLQSFDRAARQEAIMDRWGTNPAAAFRDDIRYFNETNRDIQPDAVDKLNDKETEIQILFDMLDGKANRPVNKWWAQLSADVRTNESMAKLGMVAFTHLGSSVTKAAELRYQGVGIFERYANFLESLFAGRGSGEVKELADLLHAGVEGIHGSILNRFAPDDTRPGTLSKLANKYFSLTGLTWLIDAQKAGSERVISRMLGRLIETRFDALPAEIQRGLSLYDINPAEWEAVRSAPGHFAIGDRTFLTPDAATRADQATIAEAWKARRNDLRSAASGRLGGAIKDREPTMPEADAYRDDLALRLHAYMHDIADRGIITPGIGDRALMTGGLPPGIPAGEALRFVSQFKLWGIAAVRQGLGRELYGGGGAISGVIQLAIGAAIMGYITMTLKNLAMGLTPRPPNSGATWAAAMMQGGGFGILGDFLFGEYSRFGGGLGDTLLGPVFGQSTTELMNIWNEMKDGRYRDIAPEASRLITNNLPFVNLFYTRAALNYLFLHSLQEAMNPGYLRRAERRLKERTGQTYFLSPAANHLHTFGY